MAFVAPVLGFMPKYHNSFIHSFKGVNNIDYRHLFTFSNNRTRSNGWKLELKRFNTSQCGNFFTYKIAPIWNRLPVEAVNSASAEQFKIELVKVIDTLI